MSIIYFIIVQILIAIPLASANQHQQPELPRRHLQFSNTQFSNASLQQAKAEFQRLIAKSEKALTDILLVDIRIQALEKQKNQTEDKLKQMQQAMESGPSQEVKKLKDKVKVEKQNLESAKIILIKLQQEQKDQKAKQNERIAEKTKAQTDQDAEAQRLEDAKQNSTELQTALSIALNEFSNHEAWVIGNATTKTVAEAAVTAAVIYLEEVKLAKPLVQATVDTATADLATKRTQYDAEGQQYELLLAHEHLARYKFRLAREEALSGKAAVIQVQKALDDSLAVLEKATTEAQQSTLALQGPERRAASQKAAADLQQQKLTKAEKEYDESVAAGSPLSVEIAELQANITATQKELTDIATELEAARQSREEKNDLANKAAVKATKQALLIMDGQSQLSKASQKPIDANSSTLKTVEDEVEEDSKNIWKFLSNLETKERVTIVAGSTIIIILCGVIFMFLCQIRSLKKMIVVDDEDQDIQELFKMWSTSKTDVVEDQPRINQSAFSSVQIQHITSVFKNLLEQQKQQKNKIGTPSQSEKAASKHSDKSNLMKKQTITLNIGQDQTKSNQSSPAVTPDDFRPSLKKPKVSPRVNDISYSVDEQNEQLDLASQGKNGDNQGQIAQGSEQMQEMLDEKTEVLQEKDMVEPAKEEDK